MSRRPGFGGRKPSKTNRSAGTPAADRAATTADAPGIGTTGTSASRQSRTSRKPGSDTPGGTGVRHQRDAGARLEPPQELGPAAGLVLLEVRDDRRSHPVRLEQAAGPAGVLGGDEVGLPKDARGRAA